MIHRPAKLGSIAATALAVAAIAAPAGALGAGGTAKIGLNGPAAEAMRAQGVRIVPVAPASAKGARISLPVAAGLAGTTTTLLRYRGGLRFEAGKAKARLGGLSLRLGKRSALEAKLGGEKLSLFSVGSGKRQIDATTGAVQLTGLNLKLTGAAAKAIGEKLGLRLAAGRFGSLSGSAVRLTTTAGAPTAPSGGGSTNSTPAELSGACPLPGGPGPNGESNPPVPTPPPGALSITAATVNWHVRETFIRYIATGEGTSAVEGATAAPPVLLPGASAALTYDFGFPFASGWLDPGADPASPADDRATLNFNGGVRFRYSAHELDLLTSKPELELNGAASRAIFSISEKGGAPQRQVLVNLDLGRAGGISQSGSTYTYDRVPGSVPSGTASSVFAGFYSPGTDFGCFSVSFSTS